MNGGAGRGRWHTRWTRLRRRAAETTVVPPHDRPVAQRPSERPGSSSAPRTSPRDPPSPRIQVERPSTALVSTHASWDHTARPTSDAPPEPGLTQPLRVQVHSLLADP